MGKPEPEKLIEHNGYVYKLMLSKEEQNRLDTEAEEKLERNFKAFVAKLGTELYEYLHQNKIVLSVGSGGNYRITTFYDFYNDLTWWQDEYTVGDKKHFGDKDWYNYSGDFSRSEEYITTEIYKAAADYLLQLVQEKAN
jgi:hypothetical protein